MAEQKFGARTPAGFERREYVINGVRTVVYVGGTGQPVVYWHGGGNWHGFGAGNVDMGSSDFQNTIIGEATKAAVDQMTTGVIAGKERLQVRTVTVAGLVAAVEGGQIILNVGGKAGVKVGDQLNVERITKEIKDPSSGQVIRRLSTQVGTVKVTDVDDASSVATAVSGSGFKVGDAVKTVTQ